MKVILERIQGGPDGDRFTLAVGDELEFEDSWYAVKIVGFAGEEGPRGDEHATGEPGRLPVPERLQMDLLTVVERLEQVRDEGWEGAGCVAERLFTCDLPRLTSHLSPETLAWREQIKQGGAH